MVLTSLCFGLATSPAWAKKVEMSPKSVGQSRVLVKPAVSKTNFGKTVSKEAKTFRTEPIAGYRNFGQWVSCQRSKSAKNCPTVSPPSVTPPSVTDPAPVAPQDAPQDPVASLSDGSNGT